MTAGPEPDSAAERVGNLIKDYAQRNGRHSWQLMTALAAAASAADKVGLAPADRGNPPRLLLSFDSGPEQGPILEVILDPEANEQDIHQVIASVYQAANPSLSFAEKPQFRAGSDQRPNPTTILIGGRKSKGFKAKLKAFKDAMNEPYTPITLHWMLGDNCGCERCRYRCPKCQEVIPGKLAADHHIFHCAGPRPPRNPS